MRRSRLPVTVLTASLVAGGAVSATAPTATAAAEELGIKHVRCSHTANAPDNNPDDIDIGFTTTRVSIKKLRGFRKKHEGKRLCTFRRKSPGAKLTLSATYRPGTRAKMMKRYMKAKKKPGFKLIRLAKGSKVPSSEGKRTVLEYTFRKHGARHHVRSHGDSRIVFTVRSKQRAWKATSKSANKLRRAMKVRSLTAY